MEYWDRMCFAVIYIGTGTGCILFPATLGQGVLYVFSCAHRTTPSSSSSMVCLYDLWQRQFFRPPARGTRTPTHFRGYPSLEQMATVIPQATIICMAFCIVLFCAVHRTPRPFVGYFNLCLTLFPVSVTKAVCGAPDYTFCNLLVSGCLLCGLHSMYPCYYYLFSRGPRTMVDEPHGLVVALKLHSVGLCLY